MNNLFQEIKKNGLPRIHKEFKVDNKDIDEKGKLKYWTLFQSLEGVTEKALSEIIAIVPDYQKEKTKMELQLFQIPLLGDQIELESRFYPNTKKEIILKVFARVKHPNQRTTKVAKLQYHIAAKHINTFLKKAS